jgi:hypothetical protein
MNKPLDQLDLVPAEPIAKVPAVVEPPEPESDEFDWCGDDSVVLQEQPKTAAYLNSNNSLVIRQRNWPDDDSFIVIAANNIHDFLDKITDVAGIPSIGRR